MKLPVLFRKAGSWSTQKSSGAMAGSPEEVVNVEMPAPPGWKKTLIMRSVGAHQRNEVVFLAPTGEEITNKKKLDQYLRTHPGGARSSEFNWGVGDTPRRSERIRERAKTVMASESEPPLKKGKRSASRKGRKEKKGSLEGEVETPASGNDAKPPEEPSDFELKDFEDRGRVAIDENAMAATKAEENAAEEAKESSVLDQIGAAEASEINAVDHSVSKSESEKIVSEEAKEVTEEAGAVEKAETNAEAVEKAETNADAVEKAVEIATPPTSATEEEAAPEKQASPANCGASVVNVTPPPSSTNGQPRVPEASRVNCGA